MKSVVAAFNQEKALVGAFSVIIQLHRLIVYSTTDRRPGGAPAGRARQLPAELGERQAGIRGQAGGAEGDLPRQDPAGGEALLLQSRHSDQQIHVKDVKEKVSI